MMTDTAQGKGKKKRRPKKKLAKWQRDIIKALREMNEAYGVYS